MPSKLIPNPKRINFLFYLTFLSFCLLFGCNGELDDDKPSAPVLVIVGEDLSGTFSEFPATTLEDLKSLCKAVANSDGGGKVYFIGIGNTTPKGYAYCALKPFLDKKSDATGSQIRAIKQKNRQIAAYNVSAIEQFLQKAESIFAEKKQAQTDLNGFLSKTASIVENPNHDNYSKWLYINSDGRQDTEGSNKIDCNSMPVVDELYVSRGWKAELCNNARKMPDTQHFIEYFSNQTGSRNNEPVE